MGNVTNALTDENPGWEQTLRKHAHASVSMAPGAAIKPKKQCRRSRQRLLDGEKETKLVVEGRFAYNHYDGVVPSKRGISVTGAE